MSRPPPRNPVIPHLDALGSDLLKTTRRERWLACARPDYIDRFLMTAAFDEGVGEAELVQ